MNVIKKITAYTLPAFITLMFASSVFSTHAAFPNLIPCDGVCVGKSTTTGCRPCDFPMFMSLINNMIKWAFEIVFVLLAFIIMVTGFKYMTAGGDAGKVKSSKEQLVKVGKGLGWMLIAWVLIKFLLDKLVKPEYIFLK